MENVLVLLATAIAGGVLLWPRIAGARFWRATVTPLASIIGSGFLVLGPILDDSYGWLAPLVMAGLCLGAWAFGAAIRSNIAHIEEGTRPAPAEMLDRVASWALAFAYVISVSYYLNLFGAFALRLGPWDGAFAARVVTSAVFVVICAVGWLRGFSAMERMEQVSVGLKLAIIAGLLVGLAAYFARQAAGGALYVNPPTVGPVGGLTLAFGLIVTVQGFETSRYLGRSYDAGMRVRSMRAAQLIAGGIYMIYVCLLVFLFPPGDFGITETAIIDMMGRVAPILSVLLVAAALAAQFSAAVADAGGAGGLVAELTGGKVAPRQAYVLLSAAGIALTWLADVFEIISYASRAFALYYALQAAIAAVSARRAGRGREAVQWAGLSLLGAAITLFGAPVE